MTHSSARREQALEACNKVINGIEDGTLSASSALLVCKRIARLVNDLQGQEWLTYEHRGYTPLPSSTWSIGCQHGRACPVFTQEGKTEERMFTALCSELEVSAESSKKALEQLLQWKGSVSGKHASAAITRMANTIDATSKHLLDRIQTTERRLAILKSQYYDYAIKWKIELQFGNVAKTIFEEYQERVDGYYSLLPTSARQKLSAIKNLMEDGNPERYAQVLTSCRRLWSETASNLFAEILPEYPNKLFKTKTGKEIDVSGDHGNNKLTAVIETLQAKSAKNTLVGSETLYLIDWMEEINRKQCAGVHAEVTREQAMQCIIHTYIALGNILLLKAEAENLLPQLGPM